MAKYKIAYLLVLTLLPGVSIGDNNVAEPKISTLLRPPDKTVLQKSVPYHSKLPPVEKPQPSFMSKLANWILPFGASAAEENTSDSVTAETAPQAQHHYLPPPPHLSKYGPPTNPDCNPCDEVPWIPMASNHAQKTVISFVQSHSSHRQPYSYNPSGNDIDSLKPPPSSPDNQYIPPANQYVPPANQYIPPVNQYIPPANEYNSHVQSHYTPAHSASDPVPQKVSLQAQPINTKPLPPKTEFGPQFNAPQLGDLPDLKDYMVPPPLVYNDNFHKHVSFKPKPNKYPLRVKSPTRRPEFHNMPTTRLEPIRDLPDVMTPPAPVFIAPRPFQAGKYQEVIAEYLTPPQSSNNVGPQSFPEYTLQEPIPQPTVHSQSVQNVNIVAAIPIPNLSYHPIPPLHGPTNFHTTYDNLPRAQDQIQSVQIVPSIKVADYLSTIEHPINVIQSPVVDLDVKEQISEDNFDEYDAQVKGGDTADKNVVNEQKVRVPSNAGDVQNHPYDNLDKSPGVQDVHAEASTLNENTNDKRAGQTQDNQSSSTILHNVQNQNIEHNSNYVGNSLHYDTQNQLTRDQADTNALQQTILHLDAVANSDQVFNQGESQVNAYNFSSPALDYSQWQPTGVAAGVATSMVPPPLHQSTWLHPSDSYVSSTTIPTTKKPKRIQIIIPYVNEKKPFTKPTTYTSRPYTTLLPVYTPPSSSDESIWAKFASNFIAANSNKLTAAAFTPPLSNSVSNIHDLLNEPQSGQQNFKDLPFDVITLQKNIDDWTQQEFSNNVQHQDLNKAANNFATSKRIPEEYLSTTSYPSVEDTTPKTQQHVEYEAAGSNQKEAKVPSGVVQHNLVIDANAAPSKSPEQTTRAWFWGASGSTEATASSKDHKALWNEVGKVTVSPVTKEKVYVVTPQPHKLLTTTPFSAWSQAPKIENGQRTNRTTFAFLNPKFLIKIDESDGSIKDKLREPKADVKVIFSEWPHLINALQTTTTEKPKSRHPLFGLMGIEAYTPPPNGTVQTISGHSRVVTVVTPSTRRPTRTTPPTDSANKIK